MGSSTMSRGNEGRIGSASCCDEELVRPEKQSSSARGGRSGQAIRRIRERFFQRVTPSLGFFRFRDAIVDRAGQERDDAYFNESTRATKLIREQPVRAEHVELITWQLAYTSVAAGTGCLLGD